MACPATTVDSAPTWLDRLRTSKGFPPHHAGLDLDHFLLLPNPDSNTSPPLPRPADPPLRPPQQLQRHREAAAGPGGEGKKWFDIMSSALAELFHMGDTRQLRAARALKKKTCRKQPNPQICVVSAPASNSGSCPAGERGASGGGGGLQALSPPSAENSTAGAKKWPEDRTKARRKRAHCRSAADSSDTLTYSRTEVTVIDTSSPSWKSQKIIFRKGLVWKVRDRKAWNVCRKKRKLGVAKRLASEKEQEELPLAGKKEALGKEHLTSSNEGTVPKIISQASCQRLLSFLSLSSLQAGDSISCPTSASKNTMLDIVAPSLYELLYLAACFLQKEEGKGLWSYAVSPKY
ncbi:hypothetical protein Taro_048789 [Colocasia esculenta]|uniref:Uncharacterized protein n=1 Tax=Colocasia esculenta TaxID=4460 RepID=A0A843X959_COLES|nr:hypothetical protein [Colocasia esculenta]